jgi:hypothetical protein
MGGSWVPLFFFLKKKIRGSLNPSSLKRERTKWYFFSFFRKKEKSTAARLNGVRWSVRIEEQSVRVMSTHHHHTTHERTSTVLSFLLLFFRKEKKKKESTAGGDMVCGRKEGTRIHRESDVLMIISSIRSLPSSSLVK